MVYNHLAISHLPCWIRKGERMASYRGSSQQGFNTAQGHKRSKRQASEAAIYCRLSRDDGGDAESNSISTQKEMLSRYAKDQGFIVYDVYVDDGFSGTTFERPDFKRMIGDIEDGKVGIVICKDLSRLGRNNALVAYYTELYFPDNDIRFIAVNDGIDTFKGDNEIMGFKSIINEYYARDISKKVRSSNKALAQSGKFIGSQAPYGYKKADDDRHKLVVDEYAASIVRHMFQMAARGETPRQIANALRLEKILIPRAYQTRQHVEFPTDWYKQTVIKILRNLEYTGCVVSHKFSSKSFKNKKLISNPESEWIIVPNTHEPIVDEDTFEKVQRLISVKRPPSKSGKENIFSGLLGCSTCGSNLSFLGSGTKKGAYVCNRYRRLPSHCASHYISYDKLSGLVLADIQRRMREADAHKDNLSGYIEKILSACENSDSLGAKQEIEKIRARDSELDKIIKKLVEQNALGIMEDDRFAVLLAEYEAEGKASRSRISELQGVLSKRRSEAENIRRFYELLGEYTELSELTAPILNDLIERIVVHSAVGENKERTQKVEIHYRFMNIISEAVTSL
jgi:DNA invertase Pin-like site-specific DNA recombinase